MFEFYFLSLRAEYDCFQIELAKNYGVAEWKEDLRKCMMKAGLENKSIVFLFTDTQVLRRMRGDAGLGTGGLAYIITGMEGKERRKGEGEGEGHLSEMHHRP